MIDTLTTKEAMVRQGYYERGSGPEEILILGSCRTIAFMSYLSRWNETIGNNRFTIRRIDPCEWIEVGINERVAAAETDERTLKILKNCEILIHEHLINYGIFNTDTTCEKNIYQFMETEGLLNCSIPQWNDHMVLKEDYTAYGVPTPPDWIERGLWEIDKFCTLCMLTSFPEFAQTFRETWTKVRYFYRPNHTSSAFTMALFRLMDDKFLHLETTPEFWNEIAQYDLFRDPHTNVTQEDVAGYGLEWR